MYLNYWNAFSQAPRVILGYYTAEAAAARCTALVEEAIQGGHAYNPPSLDGLTER